MVNLIRMISLVFIITSCASLPKKALLPQNYIFSVNNGAEKKGGLLGNFGLFTIKKKLHNGFNFKSFKSPQNYSIELKPASGKAEKLLRIVMKEKQKGKFYIKDIAAGRYRVTVFEGVDKKIYSKKITIYNGLDTSLFIDIAMDASLKGRCISSTFNRYNWSPLPTCLDVIHKPVSQMTFDELKCAVIATSNVAKKRAIVKEYIRNKQKNSSIPIVEKDKVIFLVDAKKYPQLDSPVVADITGHYKAMYRLSGTRLMFAEYKIAMNRVREYMFTSVVTSFLDKFNKRKTTLSGYGKRSLLYMPLYKKGWVFYNRRWVPKGKLIHIKKFKSKIVPERTVHVYLPPGYEKNKQEYPVLYMHDGQVHINGKITNVLDNLIQRKKIPKIICVLINNMGSQRHLEYVPKDLYSIYPILKRGKFKPDNNRRVNQYSRFVATEVVPFIEKKYRAIKNRKNRAIAGQSFGGVVSYYIGFKYPKIFGKVGGQSGYWKLGYKKSKNLDQDLYFDFGSGSHDSGFIPLVLRDLKETFKKKKYSYKYIKLPGVHSPTSWLSYIDGMIQFFWGKGKK